MKGTGIWLGSMGALKSFSVSPGYAYPTLTTVGLDVAVTGGFLFFDA